MCVTLAVKYNANASPLVRGCEGVTTYVVDVPGTPVVYADGDFDARPPSLSPVLYMCRPLCLARRTVSIVLKKTVCPSPSPGETA